MKAIDFAQKAAEKAFDDYLLRNHSTATQHIPEEVIEEAQKAYRDFGGSKRIDVRGHGNRTHPVCSVTVTET